MGIEDLLRPVLEQIAKLRSLVELMPTIRWGTVTQASPLRVQLDGDALPLAITPQSVVRGLGVNARVVCIEQHRRVLVIAANGDPAHRAFAEARGSVTVSHAASAASVTGVTITLPTGRFTQPPLALASLGSAPSGSQKCVARVYQSTTTSLTAGIWTGDSTTPGTTHCDVLVWSAVQMSAGSAAG